MLVKDLLEQLKQFDPELPVLLSSDEEGNSYHEARIVNRRLYHSNHREFEILSQEDFKYMKEEEGYTEEELPKLSPCVVIWP